MEVFPRNVYERGFAVFVLIFALLVFSSFLSSLTASMTQLRQLSWRFDKNLSVLRKYLRNYDISPELSIRILKFVEYSLTRTQFKIRETDVALLGILSTPLRMELVQETYEPIMISHPFLKAYAEVSPIAMRRVCNRAAQCFSYSEGDTVFADMQKADGMLVLMSGRLQYLQRRRRGQCPNDFNTVDIDGEKHRWCCEGAMWCEWEHVGMMMALENSETMTIDPAMLIEETRLRPSVLRGTCYYGLTFVQRLNHIPETDWSDLPCLDEEELLDLIGRAFSDEDEERDTFFGSVAMSLGVREMTNGSQGLGEMAPGNGFTSGPPLGNGLSSETSGLSDYAGYDIVSKCCV